MNTHQVGFGTYKLTGKTCTDAVREALACGYRIIDTATYYENFGAIREALVGYDRSELYIISKAWHDMQSPDKLRQDFAQLKLLKK